MGCGRWLNTFVNASSHRFASMVRLLEASLSPVLDFAIQLSSYLCKGGGYGRQNGISKE
jgi:hypothetical protein